ncbi:hypothetical protein [Hymenobacter negativus]|uniref:DUF4890 domain-containing protein n=1 Tax=Hymenobacter negativus TaxID=2795026 RepID=A0ABS3QFB0_9BACT|nr:hypothetical protein [Hymenobacter negativus]MBO2009941.1 hypothetical protein [Hymenobacter negativus]
MKRPPLTYLLLLPLLAVLLFGNCGGGVREVVNNMSSERHERLQAIILQQRAERAAARRQLHGEARREAYFQIEEKTTASADSLFGQFGNGRTKWRKRRNKLERQALRKDNSALIPAIRIPIDTR